jgi:hypothetical protein
LLCNSTQFFVHANPVPAILPCLHTFSVAQKLKLFMSVGNGKFCGDVRWSRNGRDMIAQACAIRRPLQRFKFSLILSFFIRKIV